MNRTTTCYFIAALAIHFGSQAAAQGPSFTGLGNFEGSGTDISVATGVSGDGTTVVGYAEGPSRYEAFNWTAEGGLVSTGVRARVPVGAGEIVLDGPTPQISQDGATTVGAKLIGDQAFRWTETGGEQPLGFLAGGNESGATGVSGDGSVIVGFGESDLGSREAFRWTESTGMVGLGFLPGSSNYSQANEISADGSTIVGNTDSNIGPQAFRWTLNEGMVALADYTGNITSSAAFDVSPNGQFIVGYAIIMDSYFEAFRWTEADGMVPLGNMVSGIESDFSIAYGVSADGSVIVGTVGPPSLDSVAFLWDTEHGMRTVEDVLTNDYGLDLAGWELTVASDISADGRTIVGVGRNSNGVAEAWIAVVPEPSTFLLAGFGLIALVAFGVRKRMLC